MCGKEFKSVLCWLIFEWCFTLLSTLFQATAHMVIMSFQGFTGTMPIRTLSQTQGIQCLPMKTHTLHHLPMQDLSGFRGKGLKHQGKGWLIDFMVFNALFNSISVISRQPVHLSILYWNSFNQYSAQYSFQVTGCFPI